MRYRSAHVHHLRSLRAGIGRRLRPVRVVHRARSEPSFGRPCIVRHCGSRGPSQPRRRIRRGRFRARGKPAFPALSEVGARVALSGGGACAGGNRPAGCSDRLRRLRRLLDAVSPRYWAGSKLRRVPGSAEPRVAERAAQTAPSPWRRRAYSTAGARVGRARFVALGSPAAQHAHQPDAPEVSDSLEPLRAQAVRQALGATLWSRCSMRCR